MAYREDTVAEPEEMYQCQTANCGYIYDPDRGNRRAKIAKGTSLMSFRQRGYAPCAVPAKKCSKRWPVRDPLKMIKSYLKMWLQ
mgnify:CR=1 FL=1